MHALVVDDDKFTLTLIESFLSKEIATITLINSPDKAIKKIEDQGLIVNYDLLITDIIMPGKDGVELMKRIRNLGLSIPILAVTSCNKEQSNGYYEYAELFADKILTKPFRKDQLIKAIHELIKSTCNNSI